MRCIEMAFNDRTGLGYIWLTLTWDVLKFNCKTGATYNDNGLTLTWDVLK